MGPRRLGTPTVTWRSFGRAYALLWLGTLTVAATVVVTPGASAATRNLLKLRLQPYRGSVDEMIAIAAVNAQVVATLLCLAAAARLTKAPRRLHDAVAAFIVLPNVVLVGAAAGAYLPAAARWLIHLPLEWAAVGCALAVYADRGARLPLGRACMAAAALLALAAFSETYLTPQ